MIGLGATTVSAAPKLDVLLFASVARYVTMYGEPVEAFCAGMPLMTPVAESTVRPDGSPSALYTIGALPLVAVIASFMPGARMYVTPSVAIVGTNGVTFGRMYAVSANGFDPT